MTSAFSESGWDEVYRVRAAVNSGDRDRFHSLTKGLDHDAGVQVTMIGETLLRQALGNDPTGATLQGAAATLTPHLQFFIGSTDIRRDLAVELIQAGLGLCECPPPISRVHIMAFFCAFLSPVDDAEFLDFRLRTEPVWAKAFERPES